VLVFKKTAFHFRLFIRGHSAKLSIGGNGRWRN